MPPPPPRRPPIRRAPTKPDPKLLGRLSGPARTHASVSPRITNVAPDSAVAAAVMEALFGVKARPRTARPAVRHAPLKGELMKPIVGSVLHFAPCGHGWIANLVDDEEPDKAWQEPIIGWGTVVIWAGYAKENEDEETRGTDLFQTELQPICLAQDGGIEPLLFRDGVRLHGVTRV